MGEGESTFRGKKSKRKKGGAFGRKLEGENARMLRAEGEEGGREVLRSWVRRGSKRWVKNQHFRKRDDMFRRRKKGRGGRKPAFVHKGKKKKNQNFWGKNGVRGTQPPHLPCMGGRDIGKTLSLVNSDGEETGFVTF